MAPPEMISEMNPAAASVKTSTEIITENANPRICKLGGVQIGCPNTKRALIFSLWDGIFSNGMLALTETFSIAAAVYLRTPAVLIALLGSLPLLLSSIGQFFLPFFVDLSRGRKKYVTKGTTYQSIFLLLIATTGWLPEKIRPWSFLLLFALYGFSGNLISGLWIAWMGDLVNSSVRGRHFAWRNRIFSTTQLICALCAGLILRQFTTENAPWLLFAAVFITAAIFRLMSTQMLILQNEPCLPRAKTPSTLPFSEIRKNRPFLYYSFAVALMQGSVAIAGPFFNVWYARDLKLNYFSLAAITASMVLGTIISLPLWGKLADSYGNRRTLLICGFLVCIVPIPFLFSSISWHLWLFNVFTGIAWSGYNLSNFNYLLTAAGKDKPEQRISFSVAMTGFSVFFFSLLGGILSTKLPLLFQWRLHSLFLLSVIMRLLVFVVLFLRFPPLELESMRSLDLFFQVPGYRFGMGLLRNAYRVFRSK